MAQAKRAKGGRPPERPLPTEPEIIQAICERLVGGESIRQICADRSMPAERTVYVYMAKDEEFCRIIARAREAQQHALIDETVDLADGATPEDHQVVKLRIWARQWRAGKLAPKVYGDKITQEITGKDGGAIRIIGGLPDDE